MSRAPTLAEIRAEMARLTGLLMQSNDRYLEREAEVERRHAEGATNYSGDLITVMNNDVLLNMHAGASKTLAVLVTGMAAVIQAEIAYATFVGKGGRRGGSEPH